MRGDIHRLPAPRGVRGGAQRGRRYAVVLQSEDLLLSTVIVAPTSRSAPPRIFRPTIVVAGQATQVLVEQLTAVSLERLGEPVGLLTRSELDEVDGALRLVLGQD